MTISFNDSEFVSILKDKIDDQNSRVLLFVNKFYAKIYLSINFEENEWQDLGFGELGLEIKSFLKPLIKKRRVLILESTLKDLSLEKPKFEEAKVITVLKTLDEWIKVSISLTVGGRTGEVSTRTKNKVMYDAAWRCQFLGCGIDLRDHLTSSTSGNYSYYAHIVASSEEGPRGNSDSVKLADDPTNIMLLCDKCHRLIDKIAPHDYSEKMLREMREKNVNEVKRLLNCLAFPEADALVIGGKVEGQSFIFNSIDAEEAMWQKEIRNHAQPQRILQNPDYFCASSNPTYWSNIFQLLKTEDFPFIKKLLNRAGSDSNPRPLVIFPLHGMSILILSGRIIGDASSVILFQYHRQQINNKGKQWAWPDVPEPKNDKFKLKIHKDKNDSDVEALLLINITAKIPGNELPKSLFDKNFVLPTIEVTLDDCSINAISHQKDLELLGTVIDEAYRKIQDEWRLQKVHLIMIAPTTACVRLGQKMQARHHADFILYERTPGCGGKGAFEPTIQISSTKVTLVKNGDELDIT
ncbi:SAVED domain-containing protein [Acinetobacter gyllenbergii]|uniref:SAVED domain-containing protein n=1 Tax=Acinetobacter gyllenbergii TaxID=134534 RepID=UPI0021D34F3F|nr:SAVED domain-containing protein [Acinetobacter gyllenbergii]MCU4581181.1 SAVED domain-containing protein [Acinetobacter gyllenbergii]